MWSPQWGFIFWSLKHGGAQSYRGKVLTPEIVQELARFCQLTCQVLPCPNCMLHCFKYMQTNPLQVTTGEELWEYFITFHNTVNREGEVKKIEFSSDEALAAMQHRWDEFGLSTDKVHDVFLQEHWDVLLMVAFSHSRTPDKIPPADQQRMREFFRSTCFMFPFWEKETSTGMVRDRLLAFLEDDDKVDLSTQSAALLTVTNMHNSVCGEFGVLPKTVAATKALYLETYHNTKNYSALVRAHQIREEDHTKMLALQTEINQLQHQTPNTVVAPPVPDPTVDDGWKTATIVLGILLGLVLLSVWFFRAALPRQPSGAIPPWKATSDARPPTTVSDRQ